jgi:hypothetical protein
MSTHLPKSELLRRALRAEANAKEASLARDKTKTPSQRDFYESVFQAHQDLADKLRGTLRAALA